MSHPTLVRRLAVIGFSVLAVGLIAAGCGGGSDTTGTGGGGGGGGGAKIGLLLPENHTPRYESADRPYFEEKVEELCPECEVLYNNATQDASKQQSQAEAALTQGVDVLVVDPADAASAAAIAQKAEQQGVPVISYDRLITGGPVDYYISFDNVKVGELQAESLSEKLSEEGSAKGPIVMINGDPADSNAALFKEGAHNVFDSNGMKIAKEYDTPEWSGSNAQNEMQQAITAIGNDGFAGVYAANDDTGGGAIAAMKGAGIKPAERPTTGQDATVAGLQRILAGEQYMTVYKAIKPEADETAEIAVMLAEEEEVPQNKITEEVENEAGEVPSILLEPVAVTKDKIKSTVIADEFVKPGELCTGSYAKFCKEQGIE